jgi:hypothetical protein
MKEDKATDPRHVRLLGSATVVPDPALSLDLFEKCRRFGHKWLNERKRCHLLLAFWKRARHLAARVGRRLCELDVAAGWQEVKRDGETRRHRLQNVSKTPVESRGLQETKEN